MTQFPCCCCGAVDSHTNSGALFCWSCSDNASELAKDALFVDYVNRMAALQRDFKEWERAA